MGAHSFEDLINHIGHDIVCVTYGDPPINVAIECETCHDVPLRLRQACQKNKFKY